MTPEQQHTYIRSIMAEVDARSQRRTELNKIRAQGLAEGRAEGKAEVAKALREEGIPISAIAEACGLTEEQVLAL